MSQPLYKSELSTDPLKWLTSPELSFYEVLLKKRPFLRVNEFVLLAIAFL